MKELSDAEVFGAPAPAKEMSDADVFGGPKAGEAGPQVPISGPDGWSNAAKPMINSTPVGGIMRAFGQGFGEAWGPERLGLSKESTQWLSEKGIFAPKGQTHYENPFQAFNEGVIVNVATALDAGVRTLSGAFRGGQAATMEALGGGQFGRDIAALPEAFMGSPGGLGKVEFRPGLGKDVRAGIPVEGEAVKPSDAAAAAEPPPVNPIVETIAKAQDLGVIGPERPPITEGTPKEVAERVTSRAAEGPKGEKVTQELPDAPNPWRERFDQFVGKVKTGDDAKQLIRDAADQNGEFQAAREGKIPLQQFEALTDAAGVERGAVDHDGVGRLLQNDNQVRNAMQGMLTATENVRNAARDVKTDGSEANLMKLQEAMLRRDTWVEQVVGHRAEWGRTGNVFQEFLQKSKEEGGFTQFLKDQDRSPEGLRKIADAIGDMDGTQAARFLSEANKPTFWDKFRFYWINALISGPTTHAKYIIANAAFAAYESAIVTPVAGVVGAVRRGIFGDVEGIYAGETAARTWGLIAGVPDALKGALAAAKTGLQTPLPGELAQSIIPKRNQNVTFQQRPIPGTMGAVIGAPSRGASAIHSFFNFLGYRASIEAQAYRAAVKDGSKSAPSFDAAAVRGEINRYFNDEIGGHDLSEHASNVVRGMPEDIKKAGFDLIGSSGKVDRFLTEGDILDEGTVGGLRADRAQKNQERAQKFEDYLKQTLPDNRPLANDSFWQRRQSFVDQPTVEMMNSAIEDGYRLTFISELGETGKKLSSFVHSTKVGTLIMPFTHIPMNILKRAIEGTPAAFLDGETRAALKGEAGAAKQDMAIARMVVGSAVGVWAVNQVLNDRMTGFGPTEPKERAQWMATGHQPYSIRIGDYWYSFNRFGPLGTMMGLYANLAEVIPHLKPDAEELTKAIGMTVHSTGRLMEDEVGMQGLGGLMEAINEPDRKGARFVSNFAGSLLPYSSMQRQIASAMDPYMRETKSVVDGLRYYIPNQRQGLELKRDWTGLPVANTGYGGDIPYAPGLSSIIKHGNAVADPIALEMQALDLHPAPPQNRIAGVKLPPKIYDVYQSTAGAFTREALQFYIDLPNWHELPVFVREEMFKSTIEDTRARAAAAIQMQYPQIIQQGVDNRTDKIMGRKPTKMKDPSLIMDGPPSAMGIRG